MDREEKINRLRRYLETITPGDGFEAFGASPVESLGLESAGGEEAGRADQAITELVAGGAPSDEDLFVLEAIVLPAGRPVINVIADSYQSPPNPWRHLGEPAVRARLEAAIPSVGRVEIPEHPSLPYAGTAFVVGPDLLMTNRHVAEIFVSWTGPPVLHFSPAVDFKREIIPADANLLAVTDVVMIHEGWDMALLRVDGLPDDRPALRLAAGDPDGLAGREVAVIGYPAFSPSHPIDVQNKVFGGVFDVKRLQPGKVMGREEVDSFGNEVLALTHDSSTLGGNSGSAVIDLDTGEAVALHFMGAYLHANYAVPTGALATDPAVRDAGVNFVGALPEPVAVSAAPPAAFRPQSPPEPPVDPAAPDARQSSDDQEQAARLQELDTTVIMEPLLKHMNDPDRENPRHHVIVEINLRHPDGQRATKQAVIDEIKDLVIRHPHPRAAVFERKSEIGGHYVFADLSREQIEQLANWSALEGRGNEPIYKIWEDLETELYMDRSVSTVKADAAQAAFGATGQGIVWAVIDSGVAYHEHFKRHRNLDLASEFLNHWDFTKEEPEPIADPEQLEDDLGHGTHVAGIIAGESEPTEAVVYRRDQTGESQPEVRETGVLRGVAPKCKIVSLRVVRKGGTGRGLTRDLMAALAHVRDINGDSPLPRIHGVNISLGHDFDPHWFACGSSPVCRAVDALVKSGVSVVVAAGNGGFGDKVTSFKGTFQGGLQVTIRDPGNAMEAITVGSTHGYMPHTYGVSYFSAKGPTGDGRLKPDLIAPGEKIVSCAAGDLEAAAVVGGEPYWFIESSGTSMAAPHVSGCIAAFLSLRREFRTKPEEVKRLFLENATDLGRERYFQGHGLVDLMRVIQAV